MTSATRWRGRVCVAAASTTYIVETRTASGHIGAWACPGLEPASMNSNDFRLALGSTALREHRLHPGP